jgi:cbb3-type cytochrome oxidase subunit 1
MQTSRMAQENVTTAQHPILTEDADRALASVFAAYTVAAVIWLLFATAVGVLLAFKFGAPDFASGSWLTFGRLRPIHTNATFYGLASVALVGLAYYVAAQLTHVAVQHKAGMDRAGAVQRGRVSRHHCAGSGLQHWQP